MHPVVVQTQYWVGPIGQQAQVVLAPQGPPQPFTNVVQVPSRQATAMSPTSPGVDEPSSVRVGRAGHPQAG